MIGVLGANGRVGRHVMSGLAGAGADARSVPRQPGPGALAGIERLFLLTPHLPDQDLLERDALDAAVAAGVQRIVKISGGAATLGPNGTTATAVAHWRSERRIEQSGLEFSFLRPAFYMQNLLELARPLGLLPAPFGTAPIAMIDVRDIAACAVAELLAEGPIARAWQLTGPRAVTLRDLGLRYVKVPPALAARALRRRGAPPHEVEHAVRMAVFLAAGGDGVVTDHVRRVTGNEPRSVEAFLAEHLARNQKGA